MNRLETQAEKISVPLSHAEELYTLRNHIHLVRKKLLARINAANASTPPETGAPDPAAK